MRLGESAYAVTRRRYRSSSGRFKKQRPPHATTPAGAIEVRIRSLEWQLLAQHVASQHQQLARHVAVEATVSLHAEIARLEGELCSV
jgi:hypothetical protein